MIALLLILIPLITGLVTFFLKSGNAARGWSLLASLGTLIVAGIAIAFVHDERLLTFSADWIPAMNSKFSLGLDGLAKVACLLNAVAYPIVFIATWNTRYNRSHQFFGLMLLAQAGMMGVFLASDALLFYFSWELALVPMYFLCSTWGGEQRIAVTFKFFIYTFLGSLLMLIGIIYVHLHTPLHSFSLQSFYDAPISLRDQEWLFWLFFVAFAIKMPVFPFHTWQPDTYEQAPTATTMILSGVMVKMGVFGILRWLVPVLPMASFQWGDVVMSMAVVGMIYASLIAIRQDDLKRLVAYSSIAHMGLMCAAIFAETQSGFQGVMIQLFNHGVNIIGLWIVVDLIEKQFGTRKISDLGGVARKAPALAILLVVVALANIGLPLTNAFPGEFLMFNGILNASGTAYHVWFTVFAGLTIILAAIYMLNMIRKVFYGPENAITSVGTDIRLNEKFALGVIVVIIFWVGIYPNGLLQVTNEATNYLMMKTNVHSLLGKP